jgi:hypothetical protein
MQRAPLLARGQNDCLCIPNCRWTLQYSDRAPGLTEPRAALNVTDRPSLRLAAKALSVARRGPVDLAPFVVFLVRVSPRWQLLAHLDHLARRYPHSRRRLPPPHRRCPRRRELPLRECRQGRNGRQVELCRREYVAPAPPLYDQPAFVLERHPDALEG